ncbi:hypothetical protein QQP08_025169 [Theobroma cacao]|nr:hypothetical protein QQP08_024613 [Theobroma cacao]WRX32682.1 hypothetical protein QQP08_025169 [Theobroma cacao]
MRRRHVGLLPRGVRVLRC